MIQYATLESRPVLIGKTEAWWVVDGQWQRLDHTEAFANAGLLDRATFDSMFPNLPPRPSRRF